MEVEGENPKPVVMESLVCRAIEESKVPEWEVLAGELENDGGAAGASTSTTAGASTPSM
jgi:hypothetical protein